MMRSDSLPAEVQHWIAQQPRRELLERLKISATRRLVQAGIDAAPSALAEEIERFDSRYFSLEEIGEKERAMEAFRLARTLSCLRHLALGQESDAEYEFIHSLESITIDEIRKETELG